MRKEPTDPTSDFFVSEDDEQVDAALEDRDWYAKDNVFWVPPDARWESLRNHAKQPNIGSLIDSALVSIERENSSLRGKLRTTADERIRNLKSLRPTGISLRLDLGPKNPDYRAIAQFARTSPEMIAKFYDQTHPAALLGQVVGFRESGKRR